MPQKILVVENDLKYRQMLSEMIISQAKPTPKQVLNRAKETEPELFRKWSSRGVASHLKRYGLRTNKSHGQRVYGQITVIQLRRIELRYGFDLQLGESTADLSGELPSTMCPTYPTCPENEAKDDPSGVHGAHGAHTEV